MATPAAGSSVLVTPGEKALAFSKHTAASSNEQIRSSFIVRRCEWQVCGSLVFAWLKPSSAGAAEWILVLDELDGLV